MEDSFQVEFQKWCSLISHLEDNICFCLIEHKLKFWALALYFACLGLHIRPKITQALEASIEGDFVLGSVGPLMDFAQPLRQSSFKVLANLQLLRSYF